MKTPIHLVALLSLLVLPIELRAYENLPDNGSMPDVIQLRKDCTNSNPDLKNCADNMQDMLNWLWNIRRPSATSPVHIQVGPGNFEPFSCSAGTGNNGYVSLTGAGPGKTVFVKGGTSMEGVLVDSCVDLEFKDLGVRSDLGTGIRWTGGGNSRWVNVDVNGRTAAWSDTCLEEKPVHFWFNSRLVSPSGGNWVYQANCGEHWIYASDVELQITNITATGGPSVIWAKNNGDIRMFGSTVRATIPPGLGGENYQPLRRGIDYITGIYVSDGGRFHMHGGIISLNAKSSAMNYAVMGITETRNGFAHTPDTAFNLTPAGTGEIFRLWTDNQSSNVHSPFLWPPGIKPPNINPVNGSLIGADLFVETDCDSSGNCETANVDNQRSHMMIYDTRCTISGPWFDSTRGKCRGEP